MCAREGGGKGVEHAVKGGEKRQAGGERREGLGVLKNQELVINSRGVGHCVLRLQTREGIGECIADASRKR